LAQIAVSAARDYRDGSRFTNAWHSSRAPISSAGNSGCQKRACERLIRSYGSLDGNRSAEVWPRHIDRTSTVKTPICRHGRIATRSIVAAAEAKPQHERRRGAIGWHKCRTWPCRLSGGTLVRSTVVVGWVLPSAACRRRRERRLGAQHHCCVVADGEDCGLGN